MFLTLSNQQVIANVKNVTFACLHKPFVKQGVIYCENLRKLLSIFRYFQWMQLSTIGQVALKSWNLIHKSTLPDKGLAVGLKSYSNVLFYFNNQMAYVHVLQKIVIIFTSRMVTCWLWQRRTNSINLRYSVVPLWSL